MIAHSSLFFLWKNDTSGAYIPAPNTLSESNTYRTSVDPFLTYTTRGGSSHKLRTRWFNTTNKNNTDQNSIGNLYYTEYQYQKRFKETFTLTAGLVNIVSVVNSELYGDHNGYQRAGYLQGDLKWKRFTASAGARVEQNKVDEFKDSLTPVFRAGVNYHAFKETYFRVSAGQGYRFPSIAEKYIETYIGSVKIYPNEDLQPENGNSFEAGIRQGFRFGNCLGYFDFAVFQNDYFDMIEFVFAQWGPNPFTDNGFKSINVGDTKIKGFEISMMGQFKIKNEVTILIQGGYTYLDPRQITYDSLYVKKLGPDIVMGSDSTDFLKYRYRHMIRGDLEFNYRKISLGVSMRYTSFMENIDWIFTSVFLNDVSPPGLGIDDYRKYHHHGDMIFDIRTGYTLSKNVQLSFIVKNVFNHIYMQRPADMQAPRTFNLQGSFRF